MVVVVYDFVKSVVDSVDKVRKLHEDLETCAVLATRCHIKLKPKVLFFWLKLYLLSTKQLVERNSCSMILRLAVFSVLLDIDQKADLTPNSPKHGSILRPLLFL